MPIAQNAVTLGLGTNPGSAVLAGPTTVNAVAGIATFGGVSVDKAGSGYAFVASAAGPTRMTTATSAPFAIVRGFVGVSAADGHSCGVSIEGAAYCWGGNGEGDLGDGTTTDRTTAVRVTSTANFVQVSGGAYNSCAVTSAGAAYCWGDNTFGQVGDRTFIQRFSPVLVAGELNFTQVSVGLFHTCGVTTTGAAYCWGENSYGQLGDGSIDNEQPAPTLVAGGVTFAVVRASSRFTCGLSLTGAAYCWGLGLSGQRGDGTTNRHRVTPGLVAGGLTFTTLDVGVARGCGGTGTGKVYCWGGDGTTAPTLATEGITFTAISVGSGHACGLTALGAVYCWGGNATGALGDGTTTNRSTPVRVEGGMTFAAVSAGGLHTCGVTTGRVAYCWGSNSFGQLGDGTTTSRSTPTPVMP